MPRVAPSLFAQCAEVICSYYGSHGRLSVADDVILKQALPEDIFTKLATFDRQDYRKCHITVTYLSGKREKLECTPIDMTVKALKYKIAQDKGHLDDIRSFILIWAGRRMQLADKLTKYGASSGSQPIYHVVHRSLKCHICHGPDGQYPYEPPCVCQD